MDTLKILNFIQYRHVLEVLFSQQQYQPLFHSFEKLELYKTFVRQLELKEDQVKHLGNIADMEKRYEHEE
jgi:hypothetical protein